MAKYKRVEIKKVVGPTARSKDVRIKKPSNAESKHKFDPEGSGYDYESAKKHGLGPDETGHWPSRVPQTGQILKGRKHPTYYKTVAGETKLGYTIRKGRSGRYYSTKEKLKRK